MPYKKPQFATWRVVTFYVAFFVAPEGPLKHKHIDKLFKIKIETLFGFIRVIDDKILSVVIFLNFLKLC